MEIFDLIFSLANESGNDGTWLTVYGFRTNADARTLIDDFSRFGVIEKYVVRATDLFSCM